MGKAFIDLSCRPAIGLDTAMNVFLIHGIDEAGEIIVTVPIKTIEQQSVLMLHRARALLVSQRGSCARHSGWSGQNQRGQSP